MWPIRSSGVRVPTEDIMYEDGRCDHMNSAADTTPKMSAKPTDMGRNTWGMTMQGG